MFLRMLRNRPAPTPIPSPATPQTLHTDARTAFLCALSPDARSLLLSLVHAGALCASYYPELFSREPIAWIENPCEHLTLGHELTARYTPSEWEQLVADAARLSLDLSQPSSWHTLREGRCYGH